MSRKVFEYFLDPEELEPFYSEFPKGLLTSGAPSQREATKIESAEENRTVLKPRHSAAATSQETITEETNQPSTDDLPEESVPKQANREPETVATMGVQAEHGSPVSSRTRIRRLLSVHALGQFAYCARSAILAAERGDERDVDEPMPRLTYLPNYDRERIEEALSTKIMQLGFFILYGVCLVILMKMGLAEQSRTVFYFSFATFFGLSFWSLDLFVGILDLTIRRQAAIRAEAREPGPEIHRIEEVNWWSLLKAGFEPVNFQRSFQHPELPLEGCPWRVLQRGSQRIPVIKSGGRKLGNKRGELYPKHQIRSVAYALLLEATAHVDVPYGLVFPHDSPHGLAFPITEELRSRAVRLLRDFDQTMADSQQHQVEPRLPENRNRCAQCDYGKPIAKTAREVEQARKAGLQLVVLQHHSGDLYQCDCGDRFGSAPPHGLILKKGLTAIVG
jgi:hypothetical protein